MKNKQALLYASLILLSSTFANAAASDKDDAPRPPRRAAKRVRIDSQGRILPDHAAAAASTLVEAPTSTAAKRPRGVAQAAAYLPSRDTSDVAAAAAGLSFLSSDPSDTTAAGLSLLSSDPSDTAASIAAGVALLSSYPSDTAAAAEGLGGARLSSSSSSSSSRSVVADQGLDPEFYAEILFARALELCLGKEVPQDFQEGYRLLDHAVRLRHPAAEHGMAMMLYHGYGRDKDFETAFHYLSRSAKQKYPQAMYMLFELYSFGEDFPPDDKVALKYLMDSANRGYDRAQYELGRRLSCDKSNPENIKLAFHYLTQAAKQGCPKAMFRLYTLYSYGEGVLQNAGIAQKYLMDSANRGYSEAQYELGRRLSYDKSNPANIKLAVHYLKQAAKQGYPGAQSMLEEISRAEESASGSLERSSPAAAPTRRISIPSLTEVSPESPSERRGNPGESAAAAAAAGPYPLPRSGRRPVNPASLDSRLAAAAAAFAGQHVPHLGRGSGLLPVSPGLFPVLPGMNSRFAAAAAAFAGQQVPHSAGGMSGMDPRFLSDPRFSRPPFSAAFAGQQVPHSAGGMSGLPIRVLFSGVPQVPQRSLAPRTADESAAGAALAGPYPLPRSTDERAPGTNTEYLG